MNGMSSPIRSPQLRTRNDFFVAISTIIEGAGGAPVTTDDSIDSYVSLAVDSSNGEIMVVDSLMISFASVDVDKVVGVVLRRVNRIRFVLATLSILSVGETPSDSQAKAEGYGNKKKLINLLPLRRFRKRTAYASWCEYEWHTRVRKVGSKDVSKCLSKYLSSQ